MGSKYKEKFWRGPKPEGYEAIVKGIEKLAKNHSLDAAQSAISEGMESCIENVFGRLRGGMTEMKGSLKDLCPEIEEKEIEEMRKRCFHFFDHQSLWARDGRNIPDDSIDKIGIDPSKPYMFKAEPYALELKDLKAIVAFCEKHNLELTLDAKWAAWNYGNAVALMVKRADQGE